MQVWRLGIVKVYSSGFLPQGTHITPPGDFRHINCSCHRRQKKILNCQALCSIVFKNSDQFLSFFRLTTYPRVQYTYSPVWVPASWFCKGSVKCTDGNNLWLTWNPDDCSFILLISFGAKDVVLVQSYRMLSETAVNILLHSAFQVSW